VGPFKVKQKRVGKAPTLPHPGEVKIYTDETGRNLRVYIITQKSMTREEAITTAMKYGLQGEVIYEMDHNDCTPEEALSEWDIL
jgi:hypothetical protein